MRLDYLKSEGSRHSRLNGDVANPNICTGGAIAGIIGTVLELGLPISIVPAFFIQIDPFLIEVGGIILIFWYAAIGMKFYKTSIVRHME